VVAMEIHKQVLREMITFKIVTDISLGDKSWRCRKLTREQSLTGEAPNGPGSPAPSTAPPTEPPQKVQRSEATGNDQDREADCDEDVEQGDFSEEVEQDDGDDL
ncbi:unnamed protein product, partial [Symbiodinium necroappetens]